ncbi:MAG: hypothetical protein HQK64_03995 [Desulfamplus sp.]|nr:hypothetical protein [Desulfamplus sp.]
MGNNKPLNRLKSLRSCVSEDGQFIVGIHRPAFNIELLRQNRYIEPLGMLPDGSEVKNGINFPDRCVNEPNADIIYEIYNPFSFRGTTYINSAWADQKAGRAELIKLPSPPPCSLNQMFTNFMSDSSCFSNFLSKLPYPLKIALAQSTTDKGDLIALLPFCCTILYDDIKNPSGLLFKMGKNGEPTAEIHDHTLFDIIGNNPYLPDSYKRAMVLKPGIQGKSEITGEWLEDDKIKAKSHVFEYLRRNSYIPWGHFAANTADDTVRYSINDLKMADMFGMRHLYYQRTYLRLAEQLNISFKTSSKTIPVDELESLRCSIIKELDSSRADNLQFNGSLWGWNFGFDCSQSGYRLHASHQQIHQQYAMVPKMVLCSNAKNRDGEPTQEESIQSYACGDMVADFIQYYKDITGKYFFDNYINAIRSNRRTDGKKSEPSSLIIYEDSNVILFVPKAQTSQWELQLMALKSCGNILEADSKMRASLDRAIFTALKILERLGAKMVTTIEFSKRFDSKDRDQRLLYSFMPKLPESPGAFSEAQLRWINGHYPEDFADACKMKLTQNIPS